ncbi:S-adenosyl-L-methionine-dependent methyltransferase [Infundibulicybe gibba]|nr:S-adenosyl-L-methionine-dependent methyltransferase [Infundibulicybe gibba]
MTALQSDTSILKVVYDVYNEKGKAEGASASYAEKVAKSFGYSAEELETLPENANMGLSCGNPLATASIKEGETVLDLGSGGGIDILLAASKVGPIGQAIGLDMSPNMISLARQNAKKKNLFPPQVCFIQTGLTESLPIASDSVDCILSNCVINLLPVSGKESLLKEAYRVLKPGGRVVLDDIIAKTILPDDILANLASYVNCVSGAIQLDEYKRSLIRGTSMIPEQPDYNANDWVAAYQIYAIKSGVPTGDSPPALLRSWDAYPAVQSTPPVITAEAVASLIRDKSKNESGYAVIDVRRNDHGGGHVRGSHQWAAQTFYDDLPKFFEKFGNTKEVIFYCGSSAGRGPRCAGWYQDYLDAEGTQGSSAKILEGGIKGWLNKFPDQEDLVDCD